MLNIFICEDNTEFKNQLEKIIKNIILIESHEMKLSLSTKNPNELLNHLKKNDGVGIYFLDVDLKSNINGIQLAEKIRHFDSRGFIIFVTTHAEMSYLTFLYKVEAMDYIIKDNFNNIKMRIHECINNANNRYSSKEKKNNLFTIKDSDRIININFNKILYFETSPSIHKIILHCEDRHLEFYGKMKDLSLKLKDNGFARCHTSFLVNKSKIKEIDKVNRIAYMCNGERCLISTRGLKNLL